MPRSVRRYVVSWMLFPLLTGSLLLNSLQAQVPELSLLLRRSYTTTVSIFPNPNALSAVVRNEHSVIDGISGFAAEVQYPIADTDYLIGVSVEYLSFVEEGDRPIALGGVPRTLPVRDGFILIPVELRGIVNIPIQSETFRLTMAGGGGAYFASRVLEVAGVGVSATGPSVGYGIHVSVSLEYQVLPGIWVHGEARFRDPDVTLEYTYDAQTTSFEGILLPFPDTPMQTRINADGMALGAGLLIDLARIIP